MAIQDQIRTTSANTDRSSRPSSPYPGFRRAQPPTSGESDMSRYPTDHAGLEILPFDECLRLLASVPVGRVGFIADGEVVVLPVNHAIDGQRHRRRVRPQIPGLSPGGLGPDLTASGSRRAFLRFPVCPPGSPLRPPSSGFPSSVVLRFVPFGRCPVPVSRRFPFRFPFT